MIDHGKRKYIFALCRELNLDTDQRREIQFSVTGKESTSKMNNREADEVIKVLKKETAKLFKNRPQKKEKSKLPSGKNVIRLITPAQYSKIEALSILLTGSFSESKMNKFTQRQYGKPLKRLTSNQAINLIETQKTMLKRKTNGVQNDN